ncbi:MAG: hypothetical protein ACYC9N_19505, partial [Thermoanaerobaculia bacterium]
TSRGTRSPPTGSPLFVAALLVHSSRVHSAWNIPVPLAEIYTAQLRAIRADLAGSVGLNDVAAE